MHMKVSNKLVGNATIRQLRREILLDTQWQYMKCSNTIADITNIKQLWLQVLLNTKGQYVKESNIFADNVTIEQHQKVILFNSTSQSQILLLAMRPSCSYLRKSCLTHKDSTQRSLIPLAKNQIQSPVWLFTKEQYMKDFDICVGNLAIKQLQRLVSLNTKNQ